MKTFLHIPRAHARFVRDRLAPVCLALALSAGSLAGQSTSGTPSSSTTRSDIEKDTVVLSPFTVSSDKDTGYAAGDSLAASRFKTRLMDSAATISVFTEEFLQDLGATNLAQVLEYGVNSNLDYDQNRPDPTMFYLDAGLQSTRINNRGLSGSSLTDFFRSRMPTDSYNTGRFDFASGPNSVLFGVANSAGSINTSTLQAELRGNHYQFRTQAGRWQDYRASTDMNVVVVPGHIALRVMGMHARRNNWRLWDDREDNRVTGSIRIVPIKKLGTNIVASYEKADLSGMWSVPQNLGDNVSFWETLPDSVRLIDNRGAAISTSAAAQRGLERITGNRHYVVSNSGDVFSNTVNATLGGMNLYTSTSFYETAAQFNSLVGVVPGWNPTVFRDTFQTLLPASQEVADRNGPYQANLVAPYQVGYGPDTTSLSDIERLFVRLEQPIGDNFFIDVSYQNENALGTAKRMDIQVSADPNLYIPNGAGGVKPNPNVGRYYIDGAPLRTINGDDNEAFRVSALYNLNLNKFGDHKILGMFETSENIFTQLQGNQVLTNAQTGAPIANADVRNANNRVDYRTYITPGFLDYGSWYAGRFEDNNLVRVNGVNYRKDFVDRSVSGNKSTADTYVLATQSSFFNKHVFVSLGYRRDNYATLNRISSRFVATDPQVTSGGHFVGESYLTDDYIKINEDTFNTYTAGIVWHVHPKFSLFANQATNVSPANTSRRTIENNFDVPNPVQGKGNDMGVMLRLVDDKLAVRLTYYKGENPGNPVNRASSVVQDYDRIISAFMTSINPATGRTYITQADADARFIYIKSRGSAGTYGGAIVDGMSDDVTSGYEADIKYNPSRNWTLTASASYTKLERTNIFSEFEPWFESERKYLEQFGNPTGLVDQNGLPISVADRLQLMQLAIEDVRNAGAFGFNNRPYKANFFTRYTFSNGNLRGFFVGGGMRWQSQNRVQRKVTGLSSAGRPVYGEVLYGPEILEFDALIGYSGRMDIFGKRTNWRVQLNGYNVLNNREIQVLRYSADGSRLWRVTPRAPGSWRVSFSLDL